MNSREGDRDEDLWDIQMKAERVETYHETGELVEMVGLLSHDTLLSSLHRLAMRPWTELVV